MANLRRRAGGSWTAANTVRRRQGGAWVTVWTSTPPLQASAPAAYGNVFYNEPAPSSTYVSASTTLSISGGTGTYSVSWARVSGDAIIALGSGANSLTPWWGATVQKHGYYAAIWRATISDGVSTITRDVLVELSYSTDQ